MAFLIPASRGSGRRLLRPLRLEIRRGNEPLAKNPFAMSLACGSIARKRVERVAVVLDLRSVAIAHRAQRS